MFQIIEKLFIFLYSSPPPPRFEVHPTLLFNLFPCGGGRCSTHPKKILTHPTRRQKDIPMAFKSDPPRINLLYLHTLIIFWRIWTPSLPRFVRKYLSPKILPLKKYLSPFRNSDFPPSSPLLRQAQQRILSCFKVRIGLIYFDSTNNRIKLN